MRSGGARSSNRDHFTLDRRPRSTLCRGGPALPIGDQRREQHRVLRIRPALGLWQAALLPAVDGRWQWPVLTCAGVLIAQFFPWLFAWQFGLLLGLAQFGLLQESGYRRAGLWLVASSAGWAAGGLVGSLWVAPATAELGCDPAAAITGLLYGAATAAALAVLQRDGRQPRRPWSEP